MQNYLTSPDLIGENTVSLIGDEYFHATRACRARVGDIIGVSDGFGRHVEACIEHIDHTTLEARIERDISGKGEPPFPITLALSLIKPARFEIAVEKCTELGVRRIIPVPAKRCEQDSRKLNPYRLQRIAIEATKQSGRSWIPTIDPVTELAAICEREARIFTAHQGSERKISTALAQSADTSEVILFIGPEGDFTPEEHAYLTKKGSVSITLGELTLRAETAAIIGVAMIVAAVR